MEAENPDSVKPSPENIKPIKKLDETVVNRIAAGEIIHRPANALKELMENSLDARSKNITVTVKNGGLKLLQIQDNGHGIRKADLELVCERFATSKLREFDDLKKISTFGFRGEALASISHVAHLSITTRTASDDCAFKTFYSDGKWISPNGTGKPGPKPCAGNLGTTISVEELFYNMNTRKKALKNTNEEHSKIYECVSRYAINYPHVGFTLKKQGESQADLRTSVNSTSRKNIELVFGSKVSKELLDIEEKDDVIGLTVHGLISNANYSMKRGIFIFFINGRLVDCSVLKRSLDALYSAYLPKHTHPFIFLRLSMPAMNVDVNVHPTKQEVHFLHEDRVIDLIQDYLKTKLANANSSRTFYSQSLLKPHDDNAPEPAKEEKVYAHKMVRTDFRSQTLHAFQKNNNNNGEKNGKSSKRTADDRDDADDDGEAENDDESCDIGSSKSSAYRRKRNPVNLTSVLSIREQFKKDENLKARDIFKKHIFVGCVNQKLALMQYQTKLFLANLKRLSQELFFQLVFEEFANFGSLKINIPISVNVLLDIALDNPESGYNIEEYGPKDSLISNMSQEILSKSGMLQEYFMIEISDNGYLLSMPLILEHYTPDWNKLPMFFLRLATEIEWGSEVECFQTLAVEISKFYAFGDAIIVDEDDEEEGDPSEKEKQTTSTDDVEKKDEKEIVADGKKAHKDSQPKKKDEWMWTVEHVLFPAFKKRLKAPRDLLEHDCIIPIADLPDLYKVFERC